VLRQFRYAVMCLGVSWFSYSVTYRIETLGDDGKRVKLGAEPWLFPKWNPTQRYPTRMRTNRSITTVLMSFGLICF